MRPSHALESKDNSKLPKTRCRCDPPIFLSMCSSYAGPMLEEGGLEKALEGGPKSVEYTALVEWLSKELKSLCKMEEHVNAIMSPEDSSSFLLEVSSFLKELGCGYSCLLEGHMSERLHTRQNRILLLDFLLTELEAARMVLVNKPELNKTMELQLNESSTASDLKNMLIALKFPKPPANITPGLLFGKVETKVETKVSLSVLLAQHVRLDITLGLLFGKVETKMKEVLSKASPELIGKPLFTGVLSEKQWHQLEELHKEMQQEYRLRREMLIKRIDVTIQSFQWSERVRNQQDEIATMFLSKRKALAIEPDVHLSDLLAAREDLAIIEKTSNASVRRNTQSSVNKVIIGRGLTGSRALGKGWKFINSRWLGGNEDPFPKSINLTVTPRTTKCDLRAMSLAALLVCCVDSASLCISHRSRTEEGDPVTSNLLLQRCPVGSNNVLEEAGVEAAAGVGEVTEEEEVVVVGAAIGEEGYREDGTREVVGVGFRTEVGAEAVTRTEAVEAAIKIGAATKGAVEVDIKTEGVEVVASKTEEAEVGAIKTEEAEVVVIKTEGAEEGVGVEAEGGAAISRTTIELRLALPSAQVAQQISRKTASLVYTLSLT
uniref:Protein FAM98A n=1 Tax=Timema monikensis TaxID=170555 RepID=A0A7R9HN62_9NEOP|nr:unnamed protein product [Timema monikensis]